MPRNRALSGSAVDRRTLLRAAGVVPAAVVGHAVCLPAPRAHAAAAARPEVGVSASAFAIGQARLTAGRWLDNQNRTLAYLRFVDADRMLHTFRTNAGLASSAQPVGGWEAPSMELRGHTMGHLLSALAQAYAITGDAAYKAKGDYLVTVLAACQAASPGRGYHAGYLSAYPENFFDRLEGGQGVWAPWYTLHKIMAGLLDQCQLAGNSTALTVLTGKAGWVNWRTGRLSYALMQSVLNNEFGGMNAVLTDLYQQTGDARWLTAAQRSDHAAVFDPPAANSDQLNGLHANTQIPKWIGAVREFKATGTTRYRDIATNAWNVTVNAHSYVIGGNSVREHFKAPNGYIPGWAAGATISVNGVAQNVATTPGSYATVTRVWSSGDTVTVRLPMQAVLRATNDNPSIVAVTYGPVVLAGHYGNATLSAPPSLTASSVARTSAGALAFTAVANGSTVNLIPFYDAHGINYTVYWNTSGGIPTGPVRITGRCQIVNRGTGTALDGMGRSAAGSIVGMWTANASTNNQWTVTSA